VVVVVVAVAVVVVVAVAVVVVVAVAVVVVVAVVVSVVVSVVAVAVASRRGDEPINDARRNCVSGVAAGNGVSPTPIKDELRPRAKMREPNV
jgi:hypothetical protein